MNAAAKGDTLALIVRSWSSSSTLTLPKSGSHFRRLSGLKRLNSLAYASCILERCFIQLPDQEDDAFTNSFNWPGSVTLLCLRVGQKCSEITVGCKQI